MILAFAILASTYIKIAINKKTKITVRISESIIIGLSDSVNLPIIMIKTNIKVRIINNVIERKMWILSIQMKSA